MGNSSFGRISSEIEYGDDSGNLATLESDISGRTTKRKNAHGQNHQQGIQEEAAEVSRRSTVSTLSFAQISTEIRSGDDIVRC